MTFTEVYDTLLKENGGPMVSTSQSLEPRNLKQIYNRKHALNAKENNNSKKAADTEELLDIINAQKKNT